MTFFLVEEDSIDIGIRIGFFSGQKKRSTYDEDKDIDDDDDNDNRPVCVQCSAYG